MARGGLSYGGIGFKSITAKAGTGIRAIINTAGNTRDDVVGLPVVISNNNEVDLGTAGDVPFGFIDVCEQKISQDSLYANEVYVGVQYGGFREDVAAGSGTEVARVCVIDGTDTKKVNGATNVGIKQKMTKKVATGAVTASGNITIKVTASGKTELKNGKDIVVAVTKDDTATVVATAIEAALKDDADVKAFFTVGRTTTTVSLEAKIAAANDATMAIAFTDTGTTGVVMEATADTAGLPDKRVGLPSIFSVDATAGTATVFLG